MHQFPRANARAAALHVSCGASRAPHSQPVGAFALEGEPPIAVAAAAAAAAETADEHRDADAAACGGSGGGGGDDDADAGIAFVWSCSTCGPGQPSNERTLTDGFPASSSSKQGSVKKACSARTSDVRCVSPARAPSSSLVPLSRSLSSSYSAGLPAESLRLPASSCSPARAAAALDAIRRRRAALREGLPEVQLLLSPDETLSLESSSESESASASAPAPMIALMQEPASVWGRG
eukprot:6185264-Pleurochrysis_carterae.AAC.2